MKFEDQYCTRQQAVELEKLGLKAESVFVWCDGADKGTYYIDKLVELEFDLSKGLNPGEWYYAYSCAELGVLLPKYLQLGNWINDIWYPEKWLAVNCDNLECILFMHYDEKFICGYMEYDSFSIAKEFIQKNQYEAHAKANLLIYVLKEKIVNPEDLKL